MKMRMNNPLMVLMALALAVVLAVCGMAALAEDTTAGEPAQAIADETDASESEPAVFVAAPETVATATAEEAEESSEAAQPPQQEETDTTEQPTEQPGTDSTPEPTQEPDNTPEPTKEPENIDSPNPTQEPTAAPTATPKPTQAPVVPSGSYSIQIDAPKGWYSTKAQARVTITDLGGTGWSNVRIMMASGSSWSTLVDGGTSSEYVVQLQENCVLYIEITDKAGNVQARSSTITCFDHAAPTVRASVSGDILCIEASDALSGVSFISINGHHLDQKADGTLDARIKDYADGKEYIEIYAEDKAGNRSEVVKVKNPYFGQNSNSGSSSGSSQPAATKKPSSSSSNKSTPKPTATPEPTPTPEASATPLPTVTPLPTSTPLPYPMQPSAGMPFMTDGNMQTLDMLYSKATNKQFITVQTRKGQTYYIVIDYDKPIDESGELFETYFLNLVDDRDLLAVLADDEMPTPEPTAEPTPSPSPSPTPQPTATPEPEPGQKNDPDLVKLLAATVLGLMLAGGGGAALFVLKKSKDKSNPMPSFDDFDDDDEDDEDIDEEETDGDDEES